MTFPTTLPTLTAIPSSSAALATDHVTIHTEDRTLLLSLADKVGADSSAITTSLDYLVKNGATGSGGVVRQTSPTLVTPLLGTPTSGVLTNCTGTAAGLTAGNASVAATATTVTGLTASVAELNYTDGVTSAIQTQLDAKAPLASPTFTGTVTVPVALTGVLRADSGVVSVDTDVTDIVAAATTSAAGKSELATSSETTTGTDTGRTITPDALAHSSYGKRCVQIQVVEGATDVATGDGQGNFRFFVPPELNGWNLVDAQVAHVTAGTTGTSDYQIRNVTDSVDMLSTKITVDSTEKTSYTAATPAVIDLTKDDVATGDELAFDCDAVSSTAPKGLTFLLSFQLP
jgi:hypothetical protein